MLETNSKAGPTIARGDSNFLEWCRSHRSRDRMIADDRGVFTYAPRSWLDDLPEPAKSEAERHDRMLLVDQIRRIGMDRRRTVVFVIAFVAISIFVGIGYDMLSHRSIGFVELVGPVVPLVIGAFAVMCVLKSDIGIAPAETARTLVNAGRCGACGDSITAIAPDAMGLVSCPTCAAAWRRMAPDPRPGESTPRSSSAS